MPWIWAAAIGLGLACWPLMRLAAFALVLLGSGLVSLAIAAVLDLPLLRTAVAVIVGGQVGYLAGAGLTLAKARFFRNR